jgi:type I restriction-modification system DNA methylase subunit
MDSINHCVSFVLIKFLNIERCNLFHIPLTYAYENFLINDKTNKPFPNNDVRILSKFYSVDADDDDLLSQLREKFNFTQLSFKIKSPFNFVEIFKKIADIDIDHISDEYDIVGMIYEIHLKSGTSNSMRDLGQYFTHRKVIKFMVELCDPKLKSDGQIETILDPSMGTGGFLSMSIKHLNQSYDNINWEINSKSLRIKKEILK